MLFINSKKSSHDSGRRERITSPVAGSRCTYTSEPSNRKSEGRRTAWLRPLRNSLAVRAISSLYGIYHDISLIAMRQIRSANEVSNVKNGGLGSPTVQSRRL